MSNSSLVSYTRLSPNHSGKRTHSIDRITPHCVVGQLSAESICGCFTSTRTQASCNYAIGKDGKIALCVEEGNRSWCSSNNANDQRAVTIECASDVTAPYAMTDAVYKSLVNLCVDVCKRNGKKKLLWLADKNKSLAYKPKPDEMVLTVHRWFASKACPGDWLYTRLAKLAGDVTTRLMGGVTAETKPKPSAPSGEAFKPYLVKVTADALTIRKGAGTNYTKSGCIRDKGIYTIVAEASGKGATRWGRLKSGAGWIALDYTKRI